MCKDKKKKKNQCEKDIQLHSYEKHTQKDTNNQKTEIFTGKHVFLEKKWQSDFHSVCLFVFLFVAFFSSSFEVNLNVRHRNWRAVSLLVPAGAGPGGGARSGPRQSL